MVSDIEACQLDEKRQALQRALHSRTFSRSEQLRSFLEYVCEAEFRGECGRVNEYAIGVQVLHKPADYSPTEDSSVRTRAYELRQKLERLYGNELVDEPVRILIPKGAYTPQFIKTIKGPGHASFDDLETNIKLGHQPPSAPSMPDSTKWKVPMIVVMTAAISVASGYFVSRTNTLQHSEKRNETSVKLAAVDPIVAQAWEPALSPGSETLLVPATPLYLVLGPGTHRAYGTPTYPAPPEAYPLFRQHRPLAAKSRLGMVFTSDALGVGSLDAVVIASSVAKDLGARTEILPERPDMMSVLHGRNAILFGAPVDSKLISEMLEKTPLTVDYDEQYKEFVIRDRQNGHVLTPQKLANGDFTSVFGLVTVLNTRESGADRLGTIIFSGITSVGTHGAAEYFASPTALKSLLSIFKANGAKKFPAAYQVVVRCSFENMLLVGEEYQDHRILQMQ